MFKKPLHSILPCMEAGYAESVYTLLWMILLICSLGVRSAFMESQSVERGTERMTWVNGLRPDLILGVLAQGLIPVHRSPALAVNSQQKKYIWLKCWQYLWHVLCLEIGLGCKIQSVIMICYVQCSSTFNIPRYKYAVVISQVLFYWHTSYKCASSHSIYIVPTPFYNKTYRTLILYKKRICSSLQCRPSFHIVVRRLE